LKAAALLVLLDRTEPNVAGMFSPATLEENAVKHLLLLRTARFQLTLAAQEILAREFSTAKSAKMCKTLRMQASATGFHPRALLSTTTSAMTSQLGSLIRSFTRP
jgi:hypothetical protein